MRFIDLLQLASVPSFIVILAARASHLLLIQKINPIAIGRGKKGIDRAFELIAFSGLILWMIAVVVGVALINGTLFFLGFAVIAAGALHWQMLREEDFCAELYGEPYRTYQARTSRYFGFSNRP